MLHSKPTNHFLNNYWITALLDYCITDLNQN